MLGKGETLHKLEKTVGELLEKTGCEHGNFLCLV